MINTIFFGLNILLLMVLWHKILKPSILDHYRDKLFDLREEVREFYISKNIPMNSKSYKNIRDLLNCHIHFIEEISLVKIIFFSSRVENNKQVKKYLKKTLDNKFTTADKALSNFITEVRTKAIMILLQYMILSSPLLLVFFIGTSFYYVPIVLIKKILTSIKDEINFISAAMRKTLKVVTTYVVDKDDVEELSLDSYLENKLAYAR